MARTKNTTRKNKSVRTFERLETREMMAGNVTAAMVSGSLTLTGDNAANMLQVTEISGDRWKVTGLGGTKINGKSSYTSTAVTYDIQIYTQGGSDNVTVKNGSVPHILNVFGASGNNVTTLSNVTVGYGLGVYGDDGNNTVVANHVMVEAIDHIYYSCFVFGNGNNVVSINKLNSWDFLVYTGSGMDTVVITNSTTADSGGSWLTISTGDGKDAVALANVKTATLSVDVGGGNYDTVSVMKATAETATFADTDGTNGVISGVKNDFGTQTITDFKYRYGDLQHDTI